MIRLLDVHKVYGQGSNEVTALAGVSLEIARGDFVSIIGPSGSGKSTLLHLIGGLDRPTRGDVLIDGRIISRLPDRDLTRFRRAKIGFVFQFFNLLPLLTARENVMLPLVLDGRGRAEAAARANALLERVGLGGRAEHTPDQLSGGEMQRVAIARALAFSPSILLADEPTGNLDSKSGEAVLDLIRRVNREERCTVVMVTHNERAARYAGRIVYLSDGTIVGAPSSR
ncbi:MAG TPA: ABC transporter ATP-binding protein [Candidatus Acidoferrales bacterium]|nr:ABC transporter ATP-binding protein [Candidatus Acidoferrales bacterium]